MATFLDISLLGSAKVVFTFLLVYILVWGLLAWIKPFGKEIPSGPYAIIALACAFFVVVSGSARHLIEFMTPWFIWLVIFLFFTLFVIRMFNVGEKDVREIIGHGAVHTIIIVIICIIILFGLASTFGQQSLEATTGTRPTTTTTAPIGDVGPLVPGQDLNAPGSPGYQTGVPQPGEIGATATSDYRVNALNTLLHPKVLAIIAVILIATVTVWLLGRPDFV